MRLTRLNVQNFRVLRDAPLDPLAGLNVFIGPNASGKSTALHAANFVLRAANWNLRADDCFRASPGSPIVLDGTLSLTRDDVETATRTAAHEGGLPDPPDGTAEKLLSILGGEMEAIYNSRAPRRRRDSISVNRRLRAQGDPVRELLAARISDSDPWIEGTGTRRAQAGSLLELAFQELLRIHSAFLPTSRRVSTSFPGRLVDEVSSGTVGPWMLQAKVEDWPELEDYEDRLRDFLPHLEAVRTALKGDQQGQFELGAVEDQLPGTIPADLWSSGTSHLAFTLLALVGLPPGSIVLIEEPELSLHPYAIRRLMDLIREAVDQERLQFLLTTHSPVVVEEVRPDTKDHAIWRFSRMEDGSGKAVSCATEKQIAEAIDSLNLPER